MISFAAPSGTVVLLGVLSSVATSRPDPAPPEELAGKRILEPQSAQVFHTRSGSCARLTTTVRRPPDVTQTITGLWAHDNDPAGPGQLIRLPAGAGRLQIVGDPVRAGRRRKAVVVRMTTDRRIHGAGSTPDRRLTEQSQTAGQASALGASSLRYRDRMG